MSPTPEQKARQDIDAALEAAGWIVQDRAAMNLAAGQGVAVREFRMASGHGFADYLLFVNGKALGVLEAKPAGYALTNVELQADKYATGLPAGLNPPVHPLPFLYLSTGVETRFINGLDPDPKTRAISLARWLTSACSRRRKAAPLMLSVSAIESLMVQATDPQGVRDHRSASQPGDDGSRAVGSRPRSTATAVWSRTVATAEGHRNGSPARRRGLRSRGALVRGHQHW